MSYIGVRDLVIEFTKIDESGNEVAVAAAPDPDLGERIVAWVVPAGELTDRDGTAAELTEHVARLLTPHKRPREVRFVDSLPRNEMGKIMKKALHG